MTFRTPYIVFALCFLCTVSFFQFSPSSYFDVTEPFQNQIASSGTASKESLPNQNHTVLSSSGTVSNESLPYQNQTAPSSGTAWDKSLPNQNQMALSSGTVSNESLPNENQTGSKSLPNQNQMALSSGTVSNKSLPNENQTGSKSLPNQDQMALSSGTVSNKSLRNENQTVSKSLPNQNKTLPIKLLPFSTEPSPNSSCTSHVDVVDQYCRDFNCNTKRWTHERDTQYPDVQEEDEGGCKMMWFVGFHDNNNPDSGCNTQGSGYKNLYSLALNSAILNARETLQPVLMLGRLGLNAESEMTKFSRIGRWAEERGAWVVNVPRLSFQETVNRYYPDMNLAHKQGPWLRMEIPRLIKEHKLMDKAPNICKRHILYTDTDVMFTNKLRRKNLEQLVDTLSVQEGSIMYGRESSKSVEMVNTGVMVIGVEKFGEEIPGMLAYFNETGEQIAFDQGLVNNYYRKKRLKRSLLPIHYNWKPYWQLEPSTFEEVKIIHMQGPKPGRGLEEVGLCDVPNLPSDYIKHYGLLYKSGICCDRGKVAGWLMNSYKKLQAPFEDICGA